MVPVVLQWTGNTRMVSFFLFLLLIGAGWMIHTLRGQLGTIEESLRALETEKRIIYDFLDRIGTAVTRGADADQTMELIVTFAQEATKADAAGLFIRDEGSEVFRTRVVRGLFPPLHKTASDKVLAKRKFVADKVMKETFKSGEGILGIVAASGKVLLVTDAKTDGRIPATEFTGVEVNDLLLAPLHVRGETFGVLALVNKKEAGPFNDSDSSLVSAIADQAAVTYDLVKLYKVKAERQRLEQELALAKTFQSILLPRTTPQFENVAIAGFYRSALEVGGDYFDYIPIDDRHLGVAVGDVSGKGIPGALVMAAVRATLRAEARISLSPKEVLSRVNDQVARDTKENVFITMTYGILDVETGRFRFCRAGHEPVICCSMKQGTLRTFLPEGIALGIIEGEMFDITEEKEIDLSREESVILYTDGVVEAMNKNREEYGEKRFHDVLKQNSQSTPEGIIDQVVKNIDSFVSGLAQHDDITLVVMCWKESGARAAAEVSVKAESA